MDEVFIKALITQALAAYKTGGSEALKRWKQTLPAPHLAEFELHCAKPLQQALDSIGQVRQHFDDTVEGLVKEADDASKDPTSGRISPTGDPRRQHRRDRRKTNPL